LGFEFEPFGEGAVRVSKVPETIADAEVALLAALGALVRGKISQKCWPARARLGSERTSPGRRWRFC
jgi:hypothetical protein